MKLQLATIALAAAQVSANGVAEISKYPTDISVTPSGSIDVSAVQGGVKLEGTVSGLEDCADCGIHVHTGTTCETSGGHFGDDTTNDPWELTKYTSSGGNATISTTSTDINGHDNFINVAGRTVVIHGPEAVRHGCGKILPDGLGETVIAADLALYPDFGEGQVKIGGVLIKAVDAGNDEYTYTATSEAVLYTAAGCTGDGTAFNETTVATVPNEAYFQVGGEGCTNLVVPGDVSGYVMAKASDGKVTLQGSLYGSEENLAENAESKHGFHVHEGSSCGEDGGHLKVGDVDPYLNWKYTSLDGYGLATFDKTTEVDVEFESIYNKPVVIHGRSGVKIACGVLSAIETTAPATTIAPTNSTTPTDEGAAASVAVSALAAAPVLLAAYNAL